jgi:general secretion pathway protein C
MLMNLRSLWLLRLATLLVWALAAGSIAYWALKWVDSPPAPANFVPGFAAGVQTDPQRVAQLLGATAAAPALAAPTISLASRFALVGVLAGRSGGGAALIAVDGKPPKPYRVGATVEEGLVLQSLKGRQAVLATAPDAPATLTLDMPLLKR